ncbi:MAG: blue light receptor [Caeruleum heppii]|nr:MAG: blue light receptor [Caeruleum heppii]
MEDYFRRQISEADLQRMGNGPGHGNLITMGGMGDMVGGDTLDDIVMQNQKELLRRRSMQPPFARLSTGPPDDPGRTSMLEFGSGAHGSLDDYQFHPPPPMADAHREGHMPGHPTSAAEHQSTPRPAPAGHLALDTQFPRYGPDFGGLSAHGTPYDSPLHPADHTTLHGAYGSTGLSADIANSMSMGFPPSTLESVSSAHMSTMHPFTQSSMSQSYPQPGAEAVRPARSTEEMRAGMSGGAVDQATEQDMANEMQGLQMPDQMQMAAAVGRPNGTPTQDSVTPARRSFAQPHLPVAMKPPAEAATDSKQETKELFLQHEDEGANLGESLNQTKPRSSPQPAPAPDESKKFKGVYSASGFDMLSVLMRVATRPNPQINIGAVDMSCAFVVCDVTSHDLPIIYCSDVFERLTGYTKHEILGRNCRFLQAPDGKVQSGVKRKYVDDDVVFHLKNKVSQRKEAQTSLINYRKGGQPFMNLLTIIPIAGDTDEIKYFVGFQVDLVETPQSVTNKNPDGSYAINYQRGYLPRYVWQTPENTRNPAELGQTIPRDDVSTVLSTIGTGESELSKRIWDKVLLENTDDVVHVLSLKGLFLYLSPSSRKILEYDSSELVGTALSSVCHPSDIVPVTRELKDTSTGASVNVVFRIRRKQSGYTWFESHGSLHTEQGKGRKCIILVGRERPVYALARSDIVAAGGIGESELWTKMSTSGMFLYVSSNVRTLLDRQPEELIGTSIQALMRSDSKREFGRILETARTGKRAYFKHELQNKRGQVLQAHTTIYPGDAAEGMKPTFLVAQTRLLKLSRSIPLLNGSGKVSSMSNRPDPSGGATPPANTSNPTISPQQGSRPMDTPQSTTSTATVDGVVTQPGGSGLPIGTQDAALASDENLFDELKTTRSTSWQFELRQMEKRNRLLAEELQSLLSSKKKRKRRRGTGQQHKDCVNCHTRVTPEWRRGPSGSRDLCNSCGLRWAKQNGRLSPRTNSQKSDRQSASPVYSSPLTGDVLNMHPTTSPMPPPERKISAESVASVRKEATTSNGQGNGLDGPDGSKVDEEQEKASL